MKEPHESTIRPNFPRQVKNVEDLHTDDRFFAIYRIGRFVSVDLIQVTGRLDEKWITCTVLLPNGHEYNTQMNLQDKSILPYNNGWWNCCSFLIPAGKQQNPLTQEEKQALIKELGVTPLPQHPLLLSSKNKTGR